MAQMMQKNPAHHFNGPDTFINYEEILPINPNFLKKLLLVQQQN